MHTPQTDTVHLISHSPLFPPRDASIDRPLADDGAAGPWTTLAQAAACPCGGPLAAPAKAANSERK
jgi:hypothetical protein